MPKFTLPFFAFLAVLNLSKSAAQTTQISLSGTYGLAGIDYRSDYNNDKEFKAFGVALGLEIKAGKHLTIGGDVDWQRFESEIALAVPLTSPNLPDQIYAIDRHQFNIRPTLRYYFNEAFKGFYLGIFGNYSYLTVKTSDFPEDPQYFPDLYLDPSDDFGAGGGITYGYRYKLTSALQISAFGSHQIYWSETPDFRQQDHQFGLGLNWTL